MGIKINSCCIFWQKRCFLWERYVIFSIYHVHHFCSLKGSAGAVHVFVTFPEQKQICPYEISWCLMICSSLPACILKVIFSGRSLPWLLSTPGVSQHPSGCRISRGRTMGTAAQNSVQLIHERRVCISAEAFRSKRANKPLFFGGDGEIHSDFNRSAFLPCKHFRSYNLFLAVSFFSY